MVVDQSEVEFLDLDQNWAKNGPLLLKTLISLIFIAQRIVHRLLILCQLLQVSGSMQGEKITQLQDAMFTILDDMTEDDYFSILTFNYEVEVWFDSQSMSI